MCSCLHVGPGGASQPEPLFPSLCLLSPRDSHPGCCAGPVIKGFLPVRWQSQPRALPGQDHRLLTHSVDGALLAPVVALAA